VNAADTKAIAPIRTRKLGHLVLMVRDLEASTRFYTEVMGLKVSDRIADQMVFLRAGQDHHDLALSRLPADAPTATTCRATPAQGWSISRTTWNRWTK